MTHINQINESGQIFGSGPAKTGNDQKTDAFENALTKAIDGKEAPEMETSQAGALKEIASIGPKIQTLSDIVFGKTDQLLSMLDTYSSKLEDPQVSLKSIAPVLEEIKNSAGNLELEARSLAEQDAPLKEIATQTVVAAQTEYLKFQRGDYLS